LDDESMMMKERLMMIWKEQTHIAEGRTECLRKTVPQRHTYCWIRWIDRWTKLVSDKWYIL